MYINLLVQHFEKVPSFVVVAKLGSFRKAAEVLSISQPALSQTIKKLEELMGVQLIRRSRSGISLTQEGIILYEQSKNIIENIDLLELRIKDHKKENIKRVRIGTHEALAIHFWPSLLEKYQIQFPNHIISIISGRIDDLVNKIQNDELDFILTVTPRPQDEIETIKIYSDNFSFYYSSSMKLVNRPSISINKVHEFKILTDNQAHLSQGKRVLDSLNLVGLYNTGLFQLNSFEASAKLASKGFGIAFLPNKIASSFDTKLNLKSLNITGFPKSKFKHHICGSFLPDNQIAKNICEYIKNNL